MEEQQQQQLMTATVLRQSMFTPCPDHPAGASVERIANDEVTWSSLDRSPQIQVSTSSHRSESEANIFVITGEWSGAMSFSVSGPEMGAQIKIASMVLL